MTTTRNISAGERWARRSDEQRAWVKERLAAVDPHRLNAWTDALDDAIAVLDEADKRAAIWYEIDSIAEMLVGIAKRATAEPEAKDGESRWICCKRGCGQPATHGYGEPDWCLAHAGNRPSVNPVSR